MHFPQASTVCVSSKIRKRFVGTREKSINAGSTFLADAVCAVTCASVAADSAGELCGDSSRLRTADVDADGANVTGCDAGFAAATFCSVA